MKTELLNSIKKKTANTASFENAVSQIQNLRSSAMPEERQKFLLNLLLATGAAGAGIAGLSHLQSLNKRQTSAKKPHISEVRVELFGQEKDKRQKSNRRKRLVNPNLFSYTDAPDSPKIKFSALTDSANKKTASDFLNFTTNPSAYLSELGRSLTSSGGKGLTDSSLFLPAALLAGSAGLGGGYYATNKLLNKLRETARNKELAKAELEFEAALAESAKTASNKNCLFDNTSRIVNVLDKVADGGLVSPGVSHAARNIVGLYLTAALALGGVGAYGSYKSNKAKSKSKAIERAQLERLSQMSQRQYPAIYAEPGVSADDSEQ
jgi:uncharacterized protein HemX